MKTIFSKLRWFAYPVLWAIIILGLFGSNLVERIWIMVKRNKMSGKIIYSRLVQSWKKKVTGREAIVKKTT
jgi:hypothetical protein